jgi:DNA-binding NtrC family response regulator
MEDKSGKGTSVDGERCEQADLRPGSRLDFGSLTVVLREQPGLDRPTATLAGGGTEVLPSEAYQAESLSLTGTVDGRPVRYQLKGQVLALGSDAGNQIVLKDEFVSTFHCRLYRKDNAWFVVDLDSTNGTFVNDVQIGEARLEAGARLTVGRLQLSVEGGSRKAKEAGMFGIVSQDPAMQPVFEMIRRAAPTNETVLITGESGSGKELVARATHLLSQRARRTMVALNCSAITKDLLESELFGHEKGAFTGAQSRRKGMFEEADNATLFLDEIGELALDMQAKLLRTLENGEVRRVGSNIPLKVNVRVIAATHRSLPERVQSGDFREDLYYRICVIEIPIPPLRERPQDIPLLARYFLDATTRNLGTRTFSEDALKRLSEYKFPGNVRELKHIVTRAAIMCPSDTIEADHLAFKPPTLADRVAESQIYRKGKTLRDVEIETVRQALAAHDGNQKAAAKVLGIARSTLIHKMEKYGLSAKG